MKHPWLATCIGCGFLAAWVVAGVSADTTPQANSPAASNPDTPSPAQGLLGERFLSESGGISLRLPAGCKRTAISTGGDDLGEFIDAKRDWTLKLTRITRAKSTPLTTTTDNFGKPVQGLLEQTAQRLKRDLPGGKVLRQDLTNTRDGSAKANVGLIIVRYPARGKHFLAQQAIIEANDQLFYLLSLTTPGNDALKDDADDPTERAAVETFTQVLDTVRLLDLRKLKEEQDERLFRTRSFLLNLTPAKLQSVLQPEQFVRVIKDGKDIGYTYITEETAAGIPRPLKPKELQQGKGDRDLVEPGDGVLIGLRSRMVTPASVVVDGNEPQKTVRRGPVQVDQAVWLFVTGDRKHEDWSRVTVVQDGTVDKDGKPVKSQSQEFGTSSRRTVRKFDKNVLPGVKGDPNQPAMRLTEEFDLDVTAVSDTGAVDPVHQELPPFYLPQALSHLLPRLLPVHQDKSYLFGVYVPERREVMMRYIEVGKEQEVFFNGDHIRAIPVTDRMGWEGPVTTHYLSPSGHYLGSESKDARLVLLPTDGQTLLKLWKTANLTRPGGAERPQRSNAER